MNHDDYEQWKKIAIHPTKHNKILAKNGVCVIVVLAAAFIITMSHEHFSTRLLLELVPI